MHCAIIPSKLGFFLFSFAFLPLYRQPHAQNPERKKVLTMSHLDKTDRHILRLLQQDGRLSNAELANRVSVSPATCHRRTQRLFDEGYITSVRALVDPEKVDLGTVVMLGIVLDRSTPESFARFERAIRDLPMVLDCHLVSGDFDYLLKLRVRDMADYNHLHGDRIIALPGVRQARTFFVIKPVKDNSELDL